MRRLVLFVFTLAACSSEPPKPQLPEWTHQPTRVVDNGYIVYIGVAGARSRELAQFRAEGIALEDLDNECSLIPMGTRIEDRYTQTEKFEETSYVKLAVEFPVCEEAKKALDPQQIRKLANVNFTQQLKKYQDLTETGQMPTEVAQVEAPDTAAAAPGQAPGATPANHFFVTRQYIAYQKQIVVLSPPTAYAVNSPQSSNFVKQIGPASDQVHIMEAAQPTLRNEVWSGQKEKPQGLRPTSLAPKAVQHGHALAAPSAQESPKSSPPKKGKRRHRGNRF